MIDGCHNNTAVSAFAGHILNVVIDARIVVHSFGEGDVFPRPLTSRLPAVPEGVVVVLPTDVVPRIDHEQMVKCHPVLDRPPRLFEGMKRIVKSWDL